MFYGHDPIKGTVIKPGINHVGYRDAKQMVEQKDFYKVYDELPDVDPDITEGRKIPEAEVIESPTIKEPGSDVSFTYTLNKLPSMEDIQKIYEKPRTAVDVIVNMSQPPKGEEKSKKETSKRGKKANIIDRGKGVKLNILNKDVD